MSRPSRGEESTGPGGARERVRASFRRQDLMRLLEAEVTGAGEGFCTIELPFSDGVTQQKRYFHGAAFGAIGDNAGGYAALTLAPPDWEVLTVEYKVNFLALAHGERLVARGEVVTAGPADEEPPPGRGARGRRGRGDALRGPVADGLPGAGPGPIWKASGCRLMRPVAWTSGSIKA